MNVAHGNETGVMDQFANDVQVANDGFPGREEVRRLGEQGELRFKLRGEILGSRAS